MSASSKMISTATVLCGDRCVRACPGFTFFAVRCYLSGEKWNTVCVDLYLAEVVGVAPENNRDVVAFANLLDMEDLFSRSRMV